MNKRKLVTGLLALSLVGVVGVGGSLAWFTDAEEIENNMTLSHVNINLTESEWDGDVTGVLPGDKYDKNPTVKLVNGSVSAWVRIKPLNVVVTFKDNSKEIIALNSTEQLRNFGIELNDGWTLGNDGYFYYDTALSGTQSTTALFNHIIIPSSWVNKYTGATVTLDVQAEAIQYQNTSETSCEEAFGMTDSIADYEVSE